MNGRHDRNGTRIDFAGSADRSMTNLMIVHIAPRATRTTGLDGSAIDRLAALRPTSTKSSRSISMESTTNALRPPPADWVVGPPVGNHPGLTSSDSEIWAP